MPPPGIEPVFFGHNYLVGGLGIEPSSTALQAVAEITRLAHLPHAYLTLPVIARDFIPGLRPFAACLANRTL